MLQLRFSIDGDEKTVPLAAPEVRFGRSGENEVVLPDYSVSRRHAAVRRDGEQWFIHDLKSTNGVQVNHAQVDRAPLEAGDLVKIGVFEIRVEASEDASSTTLLPGTDPGDPLPTQRSEPVTPEPGPSRAAFAAPPPTDPLPRDSAIHNATIVRSLSDFSAAFSFGAEKSEAQRSKREALDLAYSTHIFSVLTRLAQLLIKTDSDDEILKSVLDIAFEALPVDRGFILLKHPESGELVCELVRINQRVELRPKSEVPISKTMLKSVMRERVALLTFDALSDQRLAGTESVRIHQIRAAMCAPLWSGEKIIGVMQLDSPHHTGSFTESDVDLLATLANFCAVALERNRAARDAEFQRHVRSRLERYHSPGVIEQVMRQAPLSTEEGMRGLERAEVTVLFADIVGFTAFSEKAPPEEVAELMEGYFTHAVEAIFASGGTLDKFIGDCVMAFFGAPMRQPDHAYRAVLAAVRIREAIDDWNADRRQRQLPEVLMRVAINSGPVVVGDIGSNRRVDYTVLGNTVNVAARLEESVAQPGDIVIGEGTWRRLAGRIPTEPLGEKALKGLSQKISAYRVVRSS